jgi:hypothetical protein
MEAGDAHELHQLVAQGDALGQVNAHGTLRILPQTLCSD